ncbi:methylmalonyl-CoA mutase family protein [Streptomyces sp. DSM 42041]|uniref:Methylmalonyl-CoA mutase family protein n=1 Tax=Streptomyces hazeniae TaxID=3075538 RepID=A0ABU2NVT4_9ACTN|nr:methylmalonyl-CoA mutase family protein [Streptomyces sp. DSM 42041]MDT0381102.1 methylmalonyl-CoA mutase family protein [Streptomyces sp. DSM 42041]
MSAPQQEVPGNDPARANDAEVPVARRYASYDAPEDAALRAWAEQRTAAPGPYRPRFMVYSGLGSPEMTARRLALLQELGAESFLLAADLPSQLGYDPDHELAFAQVGRAGVSCATLEDFATICSGLDLESADSVGMLANSVGHIGLAMVTSVLRDRGATGVRLVMQNDPLKEFTARGTEVHEPEQAVRIACDCVAYAIDEDLPGAALTVCSNHYDVAGAGPVLAVALAFANATVYVDELVARGYAPADVLRRMMFFLNERSDLYVGASLFRTARGIWADLVADRYGLPVAEQPVMSLMGYAHGLESADEPLVNIPRVTLSVLASMAGGVDYLCATGYDEALRIPSADAAALALRTMQVVGYEHGAMASLDPFAGSAKLNRLDAELAERVTSELQRIEDNGGALEALRNGWITRRIDEGRGTRQRQLEEGVRPMVGANVLASPRHRHLFAGSSAGEVDFAAVERDARDRLRAHKEKRDETAVRGALREVEEAAAGTANLLPPTRAALLSGATAQEIVGATRTGFAR